MSSLGLHLGLVQFNFISSEIKEVWADHFFGKKTLGVAEMVDKIF
jgi:hypothetical protein